MYCPNCGYDAGNSKFCGKCGTIIPEDTATVTPESIDETANESGNVENDTILNADRPNESFFENAKPAPLSETIQAGMAETGNTIASQKKKSFIIYLTVGAVLVAALICALILKPKYVTNKTIKVNAGESNTLTGAYTGYFKMNKPEGTGEFSASTSAGKYFYSGNWTKGQPDEKIIVEDYALTVEFEEESLKGTYSGETKNLAPDGTGKFSYEENDKLFLYNGAFENGKPSGKGKLKSNFYSVHFKENDRVGEYDGEVLNLNAEGQGVFSATNSKNEKYIYEGEWKNGLFDGQGTQKVETKDGDVFYEGTFKEGVFAPSVSEFYKFIGRYLYSVNNGGYDVTENADKFLKENNKLFLKNSAKDYNGKYEDSFSYKSYAKNQKNYGSKLIKIKLKIVQIEEFDFTDDLRYTAVIAEDSNGNVYRGYKYNYTSGVNEGDSVNAVLLPLDYHTYPNLEGSLIFAIASAFVSLTK